MKLFHKLSLRSRLVATLLLTTLPVSLSGLTALGIIRLGFAPQHGALLVAIVFGAGLILSACLAWAVISRCLAPLRMLAHSVESFSAVTIEQGGELSLPDDAPGEIGVLARLIKKTLVQLQEDSHNAAQEAVRRTEELGATFDSAAVGIMRVAPDGRLLQVNAKLCEILRYSREELLKLKCDQFTHPDDLSREARCLAELTAGQATNYTLEKRCRTREGQDVWVRFTSSLLRDRYRLSFVEDITDKKFAEEQWRRRNDCQRGAEPDRPDRRCGTGPAEAVQGHH